MRQVFEYYLENCYQAMVHENELSFEFRDYLIKFSFERTFEKTEEDDDSNEQYYSFHGIENMSDISQLLNENIEFISLKIEKYEYLGWREDTDKGQSITNEMYFFVKQLRIFDKRVVEKFFVDIDYGDGMCDVAGNYLFLIELCKDFWWQIQLAHYIRNLIEAERNIVPDFYTIFFRKNILIKDSKFIPILSTNTKVRRLGYFKILSIFLKENKKVSIVAINKKFENYCIQYQELLKDNKFKKGLISNTKSGISAKPYIDTANDLGFLNKINNIYYTGKSFKVYQTLQKEFANPSNIFVLNDFDKIYYLECILRNDYFYFSNLLELIFIEEKTTYSDLVKIFQKQLIDCLEEYKSLNAFNDRKALNNIDTILTRIKKWEKADVYLEHILMPRLNWMLDLGIVSGTNNEYIITDSGFKLFQHLCIWNDINTNKIISPNAFLDRFMIHLYDECYNNGNVTNPENLNLILEKMYHHIDSSFALFKTLAPNRVTASQAVNYAKYKLYLNDKIKVGSEFILGRLSEKEQDKFIFKYQEQYQDGYIQKMN